MLACSHAYPRPDCPECRAFWRPSVVPAPEMMAAQLIATRAVRTEVERRMSRWCIHDTPGGCDACTAVAARVRQHDTGEEIEIRGPEAPTLGRYTCIPRGTFAAIRAGLADPEIRRVLEHEARQWAAAVEGHRHRAEQAGGDDVGRRTHEERAERAERWQGCSPPSCRSRVPRAPTLPACSPDHAGRRAQRDGHPHCATVYRVAEGAVTLRAPFPWFGGKSAVADEIWSRLGKPKQYIEPFCGSAAVLLSAPQVASLEVIGDANCYVANFWRAVRFRADEVWAEQDYPVSHGQTRTGRRSPPSSTTTAQAPTELRAGAATPRPSPAS